MHPDPADLLEYRLESLERFVSERRVLGVFDAAATVRQLLIDERPLVTTVNREWRLRIEFQVNTIPPHLMERMEEEHRILYLGPGLAPDRANLGLGTRILTRDRFLQEPILLTAWHRVTVREFVLFAANKAGGVHFDPVPDKTSDTLNALMRALDSDEHPIFGNTMLSISEIVLRALAPLRASISAREQPG